MDRPDRSLTVAALIETRPPRVRPARGCAARRAFTIVELLSVIAIIALILGIGIPAFNAMTGQNRVTAAEQSLSGILSRAYVAAVGERSMIAVRFVRADWVIPGDPAQPQQPGLDKRQAVLLYRWNGGVLDPASSFSFSERFQLLEGTTPQLMPENTWFAPIEGLESTGNPATPTSLAANVLAGTLARFDIQASRTGTQLCDLDDFMIVLGPQGAVLPQLRAYPLRMSDYTNWPTTAAFENVGDRYAFTGLFMYEREPLVTLGPSATAAERQLVLKRSAKPYTVTRVGGQLVQGQP
ncbi:MAG: prepilin-type N-terminal cleavage/methylation domain-containing protein [Phycisphaerae bacterium]